MQEAIPGSGWPPGEGNGIPHQYPSPENPVDRGAWWATVHRVAKSWTWLKQLSMHTRMLSININSLSKWLEFSEDISNTCKVSRKDQGRMGENVGRGPLQIYQNHADIGTPIWFWYFVTYPHCSHVCGHSFLFFALTFILSCNIVDLQYFVSFSE